jgi:hypothetical protein
MQVEGHIPYSLPFPSQMRSLHLHYYSVTYLELTFIHVTFTVFPSFLLIHLLNAANVICTVSIIITCFHRFQNHSSCRDSGITDDKTLVYPSAIWSSKKLGLLYDIYFCLHLFTLSFHKSFTTFSSHLKLSFPTFLPFFSVHQS